jgi:hypothetical protein
MDLSYHCFTALEVMAEDKWNECNDIYWQF